MLEIVQSLLLVLVPRSVDWMFAKKSLRRYDPPAEGQHAAPFERASSITNVLLDALDLVCSLRRIGWSWSYKPFPKPRSWSTFIPTVLSKLLLNFPTYDISHYLVQLFRPVNVPAGDTIFDPTLSFAPRCVCAGFYTVCGGVIVYAIVEVLCHTTTLIGRIFLRQPAWRRPPLTHRP
jgi:hypothetical protein